MGNEMQIHGGRAEEHTESLQTCDTLHQIHMKPRIVKTASARCVINLLFVKRLHVGADRTHS
ncbi:hypothetical protein NQZ68_029586 [Dissostichus eleginoides]|nr:hypothetical protein NQZ68_029586 [Dissostichus eleginoides]